MTMSGLARIQRDFQEFLLRQAPGIVDHVAGTERVPISTRLGIYSGGYRSRLVEALQTNYPALSRLIGERDFAQLASEYIAAHDSRHFSIRYYGDALAECLATDVRYRPVPLLAELAQWEWTMTEVFDAADAAPIGIAALAHKAPDDWAALRFVFHPSVRVLSLAWNTPQIWKALIEENEKPQARLGREPTSWLLWRRELQELYRPLTLPEEDALATARAGDSFGDVCEATCRHFSEDEAPAHAAAFLRTWIEAGLITAVA